MTAIKLRDLKKGEYFTLKPIEEPKETQVYIKDDYDRSDKRFCCIKFSDVNSWRMLKGDREVYTDFTF